MSGEMIIGIIVLCLWGYWIYKVWSEYLSERAMKNSEPEGSNFHMIAFEETTLREVILESLVYPPITVGILVLIFFG